MGGFLYMLNKIGGQLARDVPPKVVSQKQMMLLDCRCRRVIVYVAGEAPDARAASTRRCNSHD